MNHEGIDVYDNERTMAFISIPTYRVHTMDRMLICADIRAPISCVLEKLLKIIVYSVSRSANAIIESVRDL